MAAVSGATVILMIVLGFSQFGSHATQRDLRADSERLSHLYQLNIQIQNYWSSNASQLPPSLAELRGGSSRDPITHNTYEYIPGQGSAYQLCAVFAQPSQKQANLDLNPWIHTAGHYCFQQDAKQPPQYPQQ